MYIYEVNLTVDASIADDYAAWLAPHIRQILTFEGFIRANWFEEDSDDPNVRRWVVHYYVQDRASLDSYFANHAAEMRRDGLERFPGKFTASRRVLELREGEMGGVGERES
jgi:hypothetical protein